ncbi:MAG: hypothetical protein HY552_07090 [Elusimicrobia bacterium]|nr:hypothetical protein [Elusimicrobiota bacterium]
MRLAERQTVHRFGGNQWLYHQIPDVFAGEVLYPLNQLVEIAPEVAKVAKRKYEGREHLMNVRLPLLNCLWNDVLHLSPIHPSRIRDALMETGCLRQADIKPRRFFVIAPEGLEPRQTLYFQNSHDTGYKYDFLESDFAFFDFQRYRELAAVPDEQFGYFIQMKDAQKTPLLWARTPHVFYRGAIRMAGLEIIDW